MATLQVILLDTCVVIWLAIEPARVSRAAKEAISVARRDGTIAISCVTLYEIAWLAHHERIDFETSTKAFLATVEASFPVLPLTASIAQSAPELPNNYPSDPMDRIIGATALDCGGSLITPDRAIRKSKAVPVIW